MTRLILTLVACLCSFSQAFAAMAAKNDDPGFVMTTATETRKESPTRAQKKELVITENTEIQLDGRACRLQEIPANASIILLDVGPDRSLVRRMHFQSPK